MPFLRPGPALALLFALGIALEALPGGSHGLLSPPLIRWVVVALCLAAVPGGKSGRRRVMVGLLALFLGALRAARHDGGLELQAAAGPARVVARVAEVPVVVTPPAGGPGEDPAGMPASPRTTFRTEDPEVAVSIEGAVTWIRPGHLLALDGRLLPDATRWNPGDPARRRSPPRLWVESPRGVRALDYRPFQKPLGDTVLILRERAHRLLEALYPEDTRGFLIAMLLGDRRLLPDAYRRSMARTGTIHFLAVSGLNVGMAMALWVRLPLPWRIRLIARLGFLLVFTLVTGGAPPVARAAVMLAVQSLGEALGRSPRPLDTLAWAALIILAIEPAWAFDVGFLLSAAAVFSMTVWAPLLAGDPEGDTAGRLARASVEPGGRRIRGARRHLRGALRALWVSVATSAGTAPLVLWTFFRVHPLGPLWNLLVGPLVNAILLGGGLSVALSAVYAPLGAPAALLTDLLSRLLLLVLERLAKAPGSCIYLEPPPLWAVSAAQVSLLLGAVPRLRRLVLAVGLAIIAVLTLRATLSSPVPEFTALDVGAGSCALLKVPGAGSFLFDCGGGERSRGAGERIARALLASGAPRLDGLFLSHPHADHVGAVLELSEIIAPGRVWVSPLFESFPLGKRVLSELRARGIAVETVARGQTILCGVPPAGLHFEVLHPPGDEALPLARSPNDGSLVVRARFGEAGLFLPGDIEEAGTTRLILGGGDLKAQVLLIPHHGRRNRRLGDLVRSVQPELAVIEGDGAGGGREEASRLQARGLAVVATWERGAVVLRFESGSWRPVAR